MGGPIDETLSIDNASLIETRDVPPQAPLVLRGTELERGSVIGRYVVLAKLGEGGMGVVFAAYDPELDRKIALKLLLGTTGKRSAESRTRLLREAQALAKLSHQNVVAIHDVGALDERVWIAMEYVDGRTLGAWLEQERRSWREVLEPMIAAGRGLSAAHAAGLLHRDFKPDNVMVGNDGRVRVMDFGLARTAEVEPQTEPQSEPAGGIDLTLASSSPAALSLQVTRAGAMMGTPAYMSPEQFHGKADARSDQFSFCAAMWEAVYGERPFPGESVLELAVNVIQGKLREPPRSSKVPKWLRRAITRGLAIEPDKRWPSIDALLDELVRGQIRLQKRIIAASIVGGGLLIAGTFGLSRYLETERLAEQVAVCEAQGNSIDALWNEQARARVREAMVATKESYAATTADKVSLWLDDQAKALREAQTEACLNGSVRALWAADTLDRAAWCLDDRRLEFAALVTELGRADAQIVQKAVSAAAGLTQVSPCLEPTALARLPPPPVESRESIREVRAELARASTLVVAGKYPEGLELVRTAEARAEQLDWPPLLAALRQLEGLLLLKSGAYAESEPISTAAYLEAAKAGAWEVAADAAIDLVSGVGDKQARPAEAQTWAGLAELAIAFAGDPLGLREANLLNNLGNVRGSANDYGESQTLHARALELRERALGPEHPVVAQSLGNLGIVHHKTGDHEQARPLFERSLAIRDRTLGPDHPEVAHSLNNLGTIYDAIGDHEQARRLWERALTIREKALGPEHTSVASTLSYLANSYSSTGDHEQALGMFERALAIYEKALGPEHPVVATAISNLAEVYNKVGQHDDARRQHERALAILEKTVGPDQPNLVYPLIGLAEVALDQQRPVEAIALASRAVALCEAGGVPPRTLAEARFVLARALWEAPAKSGRDHPRALEVAEQARAGSSEAGEAGAEALTKVEAWLAERG